VNKRIQKIKEIKVLASYCKFMQIDQIRVRFVKNI
jgi:hypothetical protein